MRRLLAATALLLLATAVALSGGAVAKKHKRLRLTCDQTTDAIFQTGEQFRARYNAIGFTIEEAPSGLLVGGGCKNVGKLTRKGSAYMADTHYSDDGSPPFPGETNPNVYSYRWQWSETVARTKKGRIRTTVADFQCTKEAIGPAPSFDVQELPC
jgi:hypothetical protein